MEERREHKHTYVMSNCYFRSKPQEQRFDKKSNKFFDIAKVRAEAEDKCVVIMDGLDELMERVLKGASICASIQPTRDYNFIMLDLH